jgi:hypothetical protein
MAAGRRDTVETIEENRGKFEEKEKEIQRKEEKLVEAEQKIQKPIGLRMICAQKWAI